MFEVREILLRDGRNFKAILTNKDAKELGLFSKDKIEVISSSNPKKKIVCDLEILDIISHNNLKLNEGQIGLYSKAFDMLNLTQKERVKILPARKPKSLEYIRQKFRGKLRLKYEHFKEIIDDMLDNKYSDVTKTFFVLACSSHNLNDNETIALTKAMVDSGKVLEFKNSKKKIIADKHCIGGIPNNRTSLIVVPIVAAAGVMIPKTSSRSITSPAGTADTMEVFANVEIGLSKMYDIVSAVGGCLIWGGAVDLSPADDIIIEVEHPLEIDSEGQMIASILSKKKCAGSTHVLIDIPVGKSAKVEKERDAIELEKRFRKIGKAIGLDIEVILTDGSEPIGCGVGPYLEALDILSILKGKEDAPKDLREKSLIMAGKILEMVGEAKIGKGKDLAEIILDSGLAFKKFEEIIEAQGRKEFPKKAKFVERILSSGKGKVKHIDNKKISRAAFLLGAPNNKTSGVRILKKVGEEVSRGEPILELYSNSKLKLEYGANYLLENHDSIIIK